MSEFWSPFLSNFRDACRRSPWLTLTLGVLVLMVVAMVGMRIAFSLILGLFGMEESQMADLIQGNWEEIPMGTLAFRVIQMANQVLVWLTPAWLMHKLLTPETHFWGNFPLKVNLLWLGPLATLCSIPLVSALEISPEIIRLPAAWGELEQWIKAQEATGARTLGLVLKEPGALWINLIVFALTPAICEEAFFRGFVQKQFQRALPLHAAIWVSAAVFSFVHFQFFGFFSRMVVGAILGYLYAYGRNLMAPVMAHFFFNAFSVVAVSLGAPMEGSPDWWQGSTRVGLALASAGITFLLWRSIKRISHE